MFAINPETGCITLKSTLDSDTISKWILNIIAKDSGLYVQQMSTTMVFIDVLNVNDNAPMILNEQLDTFLPSNIGKGKVFYINLQVITIH